MFSHYNVSLERCDTVEKTDEEIEEMIMKNREQVEEEKVIIT